MRSDDEYRSLKEALHTLSETKQIRQERRGKVGHVHIPLTLVGVLQIKKQGLGFVTVRETNERVFIAPRFLGTAMHGDTVEVSLFAQPNKKREDAALPEGEIIKVLERSRTNIVGTLEQTKRAFIVVPDDRRMGADVFVPKEHTAGAVPGQKVVVQIESWGVSHLNPEGRIVNVLGRAGEVSAELLSVFHEYQLPLGFPAAVEQEAAGISADIPKTEIARRLDFRNNVCFTIDPEDAKDFDDAVSLEKLDDGNWNLGVHIADVSYYVNEGTALDREALQRGTSVYFPNAVIPMLPEKLSNELCSLRPNEDRLAYSVFMHMTPQGVVKGYEIHETVICSKRRFTYEEVQEILDGKKRKLQDDDFADLLSAMHTLSTTLTAKRMKEGSIDFDSSEAKFCYDDEGKPTEIIKKERLASHRLVEEFMLAANRTVGRHTGV
ncbi:MAG TPA: RNB domain-containing ribonuclease, partial [Bacteroidota bacterium]